MKTKDIKEELRAKFLEKMADYVIECEKEMIKDGITNTERAYTVQFIEEAYQRSFNDNGPDLADKAWEAGRDRQYSESFGSIPSPHPSKGDFMKDLFNPEP